jgi:hypothetical protein
MKVTITTINNNEYHYKDITSVLERTSANSGMKWLVLKTKDDKKSTDNELVERDYVKISLSEIETIRYN